MGYENLFISEIRVAELKYGAEKSADPEKNSTLINELLSVVEVLPIYPALDIYAKEKARLSRIGKIIDDLDLFIGASAIKNQLILVTHNLKHFERLKGIQIEDWTMS